MLPVVKEILVLFGFTKHQMFIAMVCLVVLLGNLAGGLLRSMIVAYSGPTKPRKLTDTIAFRMLLISELMLLLFAFYYHVIMIGEVEASHIVYWSFTVISAPVLAYIGAQITYLVFQKRIEANKKAYIKWERKMREKRLAAREAAKKAQKPVRRGGRAATKRFTPGRSL